MTYKRLTLKDLTADQRRQLSDKIAAACQLHGVQLGHELPENVRQQITRETMDRFAGENAAAALAEEKARSAARVAGEIKTFTWGAARRR